MFAVSFIVNNIKSLVCLWNVFRRVKFIDFFFFRALPLCSHNLPARYPSLSLPFSGAPVHLVIRFLDAFFSVYLAKSCNTHPCVRSWIRYSVFRCSVCVWLCSKNVDINYISPVCSIIRKQCAHTWIEARETEFGETHPIFKCHRDYINDQDIRL